MLNITVEDHKIIKKKSINIGMATALNDGNLIVPVIKNADQLSLIGLVRKVNDLENCIKSVGIDGAENMINKANSLSPNLEYILAKKGDKGMTIVGKNDFVKHIDSHKVKNPDVTGAGDTVIATFSLAFTKTNNIEVYCLPL